MTALRQIMVILASAVLAFTVLSVIVPGPIAVHWNGTEEPTGAAVPTWVIGAALLALMVATAWVYRAGPAAVRILVAEAVFGLMFVLVVAASSNTAVLAALLLGAIAATLSYFGAGRLLRTPTAPPVDAASERGGIDR